MGGDSAAVRRTQERREAQQAILYVDCTPQRSGVTDCPAREPQILGIRSVLIIRLPLTK